MATSLLFRSSLHHHHHHHHHHRLGPAKPNPFSSSPPSFSPAGKGRFPSLRSIKMQGSDRGKRKVFVAGAMGSTERKIVDQLLAKGFAVSVGVHDLEEAKSTFSCKESLQFDKVELTDPPERLEKAIGNGTEAVVCVTEFIKPEQGLFAPRQVDYFGTVNLVKACKERSVTRFILISSIILNIAAAGQKSDGGTEGKQPDDTARIFLHALHQALLAEQHIRTSGINYTIIRPVSLKDDTQNGNTVMRQEDPLYKVSVSRDMVAEVAVEALSDSNSHYQVVEIIA